MIATWALIVEPFVEKSVSLAPTASANSSCAVDWTLHARSRVSTPWLSGKSKRAAPIPAQRVNSGAGPRPPACAGMLKLSRSCSQYSRMASASGTVSRSLVTGPRRRSALALARLSVFLIELGVIVTTYPNSSHATRPSLEWRPRTDQPCRRTLSRHWRVHVVRDGLRWQPPCHLDCRPRDPPPL